MARQIGSELLEQIQLHAVAHLPPSQARETSLSVNRQVFEAGEQIGPPNQRVTLDEPALVVFADDDPLANWGHACRYLLSSP